MNRRVIAGAYLAHLATFGPAYSYGVLAVPVARELALSTWGVLAGRLPRDDSLPGSLRVTGRLADRVGARPLMLTGAMLVGGGLVLAALAPNLLVLVPEYVVLFGAGSRCASCPRWRRRVPERGPSSSDRSWHC